MKIVCIDFETANRFSGSVCAAGTAVIDDGEITDTRSWLIRPHADYSHFDPFNIMIHGIREKDVENAPEFDAVYRQMEPLFKDAVLAAHNAAFDMGCLRDCLDIYNIPYPDSEYLCTYKIALRVWPGLENYKLSTISKYLDFSFKHHDALEDARACANILVSAMKLKGINSVNLLADSIGLEPGRLYAGGYSPCNLKGGSTMGITAATDKFDMEHEFYKKKVVFTGTLKGMKRREAMQRVVNAGGYIAEEVNEDTDFLVMGFQDYSRFADGRQSIKTKKAKSFIASGGSIQIIDEEDFLRMI